MIVEIYIEKILADLVYFSYNNKKEVKHESAFKNFTNRGGVLKRGQSLYTKLEH